MCLSTILADFSRYISAWKLCTMAKAEDDTDTLTLALTASGCDRATAHHKARLPRDNGPSDIAGELAEYIEARAMSQVRGSPSHPRPRARSSAGTRPSNRILLENYFLPGVLEAQIEPFGEHYNHRRYHVSLDNVTPANAYFARAQIIIKQRERMKRHTMEHRRPSNSLRRALRHQKLAA